jgi:hypothetical protein
MLEHYEPWLVGGRPPHRSEPYEALLLYIGPVEHRNLHAVLPGDLTGFFGEVLRGRSVGGLVGQVPGEEGSFPQLDANVDAPRGSLFVGGTVEDELEGFEVAVGSVFF